MADSWRDIGGTIEKFLLKPDWSRDPSNDFDFNRLLINEIGGSYDIYNRSDNLTRFVEYGYTNLGREDQHYLITFFIDKQGKLKRFWLPYRKNSFQLHTSISNGNDTIRIYNVNANKIIQGHELIYFEMANGDYISRNVQSITDNEDGTETLNLITGIDRDIAASDFIYFSWLFLVRFDINSLIFNHLSSAISKCSIKFKELPEEYPLTLQSGGYGGGGDTS